MNSQLFFLLNLVFAVLFLLWFLSGRKGSGTRPTQLDLRRGEPLSKRAVVKSEEMHSSVVESEKKHLRPESEGGGIEEGFNLESVDHRIEKAKSLNILFIYNGHSWDAYEVLGVPAGANIQVITAQYQKLIKSADRGQLEFYEAAYQTILKKI